jgi:hypothetical protein
MWPFSTSAAAPEAERINTTDDLIRELNQLCRRADIPLAARQRWTYLFAHADLGTLTHTCSALFAILEVGIARSGK